MVLPTPAFYESNKQGSSDGLRSTNPSKVSKVRRGGRGVESEGGEDERRLEQLRGRCDEGENSRQLYNNRGVLCADVVLV